MSQTYIKDTALYKGHSPHQDRCVSQKISCEGVGRRPISFGQTNWHTQMWLKQWMQYELFLENLVLVDLKRVGPPWALPWHGRVHTFGPRDQHDQRNFWCLFGVYYWSAPVSLKRNVGIWESRSKFFRCEIIGINCSASMSYPIRLDRVPPSANQSCKLHQPSNLRRVPKLDLDTHTRYRHQAAASQILLDH